MSGRARALLVATSAIAVILFLSFEGLWLVMRQDYARAPEIEAAGDLRTLISAQIVYRDATGHYGRPDCLVRPAECMAEGANELPPLVGPKMLRGVRHGYLFTFHAVPSDAARAGSRGALSEWAVVAVPVDPEGASLITLCADSSERICLARDGQPHRISNGRCPAECALAY